MLSHRHPKTAPCVNRSSLLFAGRRNGDGAQGQVRVFLLDCDFDQSLLDRRFNQAGESRIDVDRNSLASAAKLPC